MDCRETQALLTAFHDGELPAVDRTRVEEHLRGCPGCVALLADLARADQAAGVPDPGPAYWDRFNARVMDRVQREADGPSVAVLRPKHGWMRQQLRYLVPAAAAAVLVVVVVRYGGMQPGAPIPTAPPAVSERAAPDSEGRRTAKAEPESRATEKTEGAAVARRVPPPPIAKERFTAATRGEQDRLADRSLSTGSGEASRDRTATPAGIDAPSPAAERQDAAKEESASGTRVAKDRPEETPATMSLGKTRSKAAPSPLASDARPADGQGRPTAGAGGDATDSVAPDSPCELARTLAAQGRLRDAEAAQRACLKKDRSAPAQEKGLVFLAELLDRQVRFAEADAVITEVHRQFPESRPLDLYRRQRPMVQKQPTAVPISR